VINTPQTQNKDAFQEAYNGGLERFTNWLESLPFSQRQQLLELVVNRTTNSASNRTGQRSR
jgi:hypothetical protein